LPLLVHYFGIGYTVVLVIYLLVFAILSGLILERFETRLWPTGYAQNKTKRTEPRHDG
jgi:hypothetical protein